MSLLKASLLPRTRRQLRYEGWLNQVYTPERYTTPFLRSRCVSLDAMVLPLISSSRVEETAIASGRENATRYLEYPQHGHQESSLGSSV